MVSNILYGSIQGHCTYIMEPIECFSHLTYTVSALNRFSVDHTMLIPVANSGADVPVRLYSNYQYFGILFSVSSFGWRSELLLL